MSLANGKLEILTELATTRDELLPWYGASYAPLHARSYLPGKWTAQQLLIHLADAESVLLDRVRRLAADHQPLLWAFDQDAWAVRLAYPERDLGAAGRLFAAARETIIELAVAATTTTLANTGVHTQRGKVNLAETLAGIARHSRHHLHQLAAIASDRPWSPTAAVAYR